MSIHRHPALAPLSRDHHLALQLARGLQANASAQLRAALPPAASDRADHLRRVFSEELAGHFQAEDEVLIPAISGRDATLDDLVAEIRAEHEELRSIVTELADTRLGAAAVEALLDRFGRLLESHVRKEERTFYERVQEALGDGGLEVLGTALGRHMQTHCNRNQPPQ